MSKDHSICVHNWLIIQFTLRGRERGREREGEREGGQREGGQPKAETDRDREL